MQFGAELIEYFAGTSVEKLVQLEAELIALGVIGRLSSLAPCA
jgi:hypothetical protein